MIPTASIGLAPHTATLVNIETIIWANTPTTRALPAATILGRRVSLTITIDHVNWNYGDHSTDTTKTAGNPYDGAHHPCRTAQCSGYHGHTYTRTGDLTVSATVSWNATYRVDGGAVQTIPGAISGPTASTPLHVTQARGILVPNPDGH